MKLAIVGSTNFNDYEYFCQKLEENFNMQDEVEEIVSGGARGADSLAKRYAFENSITYVEYPAEWHIYGKAAGPVRNRQIVDRADVVIAFWDWKSLGTKHTIETAKNFNKRVVVENVEDKVDEV